MKLKVGYKEMVARAEEQVKTISVAEATALHQSSDAVFIDLRDIRELYREGKIPGAKHVPRGMLEFWIDPESPYYKPLFAEEKTFLFGTEPSAYERVQPLLRAYPAMEMEAFSGRGKM